MATGSSVPKRVQAFREEKHGAFVVGYTGEVGKELVKELASADIFQRVVLIGRRQVDLPTGSGYEKMTQKVVDFERLEEHKEAFAGLDVGFCALGTTRGKSGVVRVGASLGQCELVQYHHIDDELAHQLSSSDVTRPQQGFIKVDHDYVVNSAKVAKEAGCQHFLLVSSSGTNKNSPLLYPKTKGLTEEDVKAIGFPKLSIFRPAMLLCPSGRSESRFMERVALAALTPIAFAFPTFITIPTTKVARALVNAALLSEQTTVETLENPQVHQLGSLPVGGEA